MTILDALVQIQREWEIHSSEKGSLDSWDFRIFVAHRMAQLGWVSVGDITSSVIEDALQTIGLGLLVSEAQAVIVRERLIAAGQYL
jgi:hypothetical protein